MVALRLYNAHPVGDKIRLVLGTFQSFRPEKIPTDRTDKNLQNPSTFSRALGEIFRSQTGTTTTGAYKKYASLVRVCQSVRTGRRSLFVTSRQRVGQTVRTGRRAVVVVVDVVSFVTLWTGRRVVVPFVVLAVVTVCQSERTTGRLAVGRCRQRDNNNNQRQRRKNVVSLFVSGVVTSGVVRRSSVVS